MSLVYAQPGVRLARGAPTPPEVVRALQTDLRRLGYLRGGLDGQFGRETERGVRALQWDLLHGDGRGPDGEAPVPLSQYNNGRVEVVDGVVDERLAACIEDILGDEAVPKLPQSADSAADNRRALETVRALADAAGPIPFLLAIFHQESGGMHFRVPTPGDPDAFIVVGLDRNDRANPDRITSRGYGMGQYTLFHHPPRPDEVETLMLDPVQNVGRAIRELADKLERFVTGATPGTRADDRLAEIGAGPIRRCRYAPDDARYQRDCARCAAEAPRLHIGPDTPLVPGAPECLAPTPYHPETHYRDVPDRARLGCDWPYAVRRYNGSGVNSYHYQFQVLRRLLAT